MYTCKKVHKSVLELKKGLCTVVSPQHKRACITITIMRFECKMFLYGLFLKLSKANLSTSYHKCSEFYTGMTTRGFENKIS